MQIEPLSLSVVSLLAALSGVCLVQYLVGPASRRYRYLALVVLAGIAALLWCLATFEGFGMILVGLAGIVLCFVLGYLGATWFFLRQVPVENLPEITRAERDPGNGCTAVLYFTHGEPPDYDPMPWIETMREFDQDGVAFIPWPLRPFFFHQFRKEYLELGRSPHNEVHAAILARLQAEIAGIAPGTVLYLAFLDSNPRPDAVMAEIVNAGFSRVVVLPVFITISSHTQAGQAMIAELEPEKYGVEVCYAEPFWQSQLLQQSHVVRANAVLGQTDQARVGVLLVGHGQPEAWDALYPTQTEHENLYRQAIKEYLVADGYREDNIALAWMEFKAPSIPDAVRRMAGSGVAKILVFSTSISARSLHSAIEVPAAITSARLDPQIEVIDLGAWGDPQDDLVMQALREKILACGLGE